jgi:hypothetical protein
MATRECTREQAREEYDMLKAKLDNYSIFKSEEMELLEWYSETFAILCKFKFVSGCSYVRDGNLEFFKIALEDMKRKIEN